MSETTDLTEAINHLIEKQTKMVSLSWNFYRGILYGLGFFVGGTLLVGFILYLMSFFNTAPIIGEFVSKVLHVVNSTK
jgi:hypothetical protein